MTIEATTPQLKRLGEATADQLVTWYETKEEKAGRVMAGEICNGFLKIYWKTGAGNYVAATFNQYGQQIKKSYFRHWNENDGEPFGLISETPHF